MPYISFVSSNNLLKESSMSIVSVIVSGAIYFSLLIKN